MISLLPAAYRAANRFGFALRRSDRFSIFAYGFLVDFEKSYSFLMAIVPRIPHARSWSLGERR
jgi:hypothetical protein